MEQTGHERREIEPDMYLREDLSIRSSRLPVIMEEMKNHFGIRIDPRDFLNVRTVQDVADRIAEIIARDRGKESAKPAAEAAIPHGRFRRRLGRQQPQASHLPTGSPG